MVTVKQKLACLLDEATVASPRIFGGKGAGLITMRQMGISVPPAAIITTEAGLAYFAARRTISTDLRDEITETIQRFEVASGAVFGDPKNPLLVSVRSGAPISMPGQMSTILNVGLTRKVARAMQDQTLAGALYGRLYKMFAAALGVDERKVTEIEERYTTTHHVARLELVGLKQAERFADEMKRLISKKIGEPFPDDPRAQIWLAIRAVWNSWDTPSMRDYRRTLGIGDDMTTAVVIQQMALGNANSASGTGVAYSRNPLSGEDVVGSFLFQAQGEEIVSGERTTHGLDALERAYPHLHRQLLAYATRLEDHYEYPVEIEFTIENGTLYLLQVRKAVLSDRAIIQYTVDLQKSGRITEAEAVERIKPSLIERVHLPVFSPVAKERAYREGRLLTRGLAASPGVGIGIAGIGTTVPDGKAVILVRQTLDPKEHALFAKSKAIISASGSVGCHAALIASALRKPCVVGCEELAGIDPVDKTFTINGHVVHDGAVLSVDGASGEIFEGELEVEVPPPFEALRIFEEWWVTYNGTEKNANPADGRPHSPWANATDSIDPKEIETYRERVRKLLRAKDWSTEKSRTIEALHVIPDDARIEMTVVDATDADRIRKLMYDAVDEGFWTGPRTALGPGTEGTSPFQSGIKTREQVDAFFDDPNFQGVERAKAAGYESWMHPRPTDAWRQAPEQIIVTYDPPEKGVESVEHEHFACNVTAHSNPDEINIDISLGSMQLRNFEDITADRLVHIKMALNPTMPHLRGQRTLLVPRAYWTATGLSHIASDLGIAEQTPKEIAQQVDNLMREGKLSSSMLERLIEPRTYNVACYVEHKILEGWWMPPFHLPFTMRALDEVYSLQVLEVQGRADADGKVLWFRVYDAKGREEKRTAVGS